MTNIPILILGAGPAGLALGHELSLRGLQYRILERANEVGNTFYSMTDSTEYGPWINNTLPGSPAPLTSLFSRTTRSEYARYLSEYRHKHQLRVDTGTSVLSAHKTETGYEVETDKGMYHCQILVNATGYFSNPFVPEYPGLAESDLLTLHSAKYVSPFTVSEMLGKQTGKILIVGCRLSAGEIMQELHRVGHELHLSHRGKIKYWPSPWEEAFRSPFSMAWERVALKLRAPKPGNLKPRLRRGFQKSLLDQGIVKKHPNIKEIRGRVVEFIDGKQENFDLLLFATGYLPVLSHLWPLLNGEKPKVSKLESKDHKNLFFLGYENARNFRSQFLRGIRDDARFLGEVLNDRISEVSGISIHRSDSSLLLEAPRPENPVSEAEKTLKEI